MIINDLIKRINKINFAKQKFSLTNCNLDSLSVDKLVANQYLVVTTLNGIVIIRVHNKVTLQYAIIDLQNINTIFTQSGYTVSYHSCDNNLPLDKQLEELKNRINN